MIKQLPIELYKDLLEGDVAGAYDRICTVGKPSAIAQSMQLRNKLTKVASKQNKTNKSLLGWLQEVFDIMQDLHTLNDAVSVKEVRQYFYAAFEDDPKYADFIRDLTRNPNMDVAQMKACLVAVATVKKDLVDDTKDDQQVARNALRKEKKLKKKEFARAAVAQQKAHAAATTSATATSGTAKAEGGPISPEDKKKMKGQICNLYLFGSCKFGDQCNYKHMSLEEAQAERTKREKQRAGLTNAEKDKKKSGKPRKVGTSDESDVSRSGVSDESDARSDKTCFQFQANGSCNYGESCRFEHVPGDKKKVGRPARTHPGKTTNWAQVRTQLSALELPDLESPKVGDMVMIPYNSQHPPFRGVTGKITGPMSGGWWPVELDYTPLKKDLLSAQLVYNAKEIGMKPDIDFIVIPISEVNNLKLSRKAYALRGVSQKNL
jgi:hypothetical protein